MRLAQPSPLASVILCVAMTCLVPGCRNNLTKENLDKIKLGMSEKEVIAILGKGREVTDSDFSSMSPKVRAAIEGSVRPGGDCRKWSGGGTVLFIKFVDGQVAGISQYHRS